MKWVAIALLLVVSSCDEREFERSRLAQCVDDPGLVSVGMRGAGKRHLRQRVDGWGVAVSFPANASLHTFPKASQAEGRNHPSSDRGGGVGGVNVSKRSREWAKKGVLEGLFSHLAGAAHYNADPPRKGV